MALDYQSLLSNANAAGYSAAGRVTTKQMLRLGLLQAIANTLAPSMQTDFQSLMNVAQVPGYRAAAATSVADMLELALLNIIASNVSAGGGSAYYASAGPPVGTPAANGLLNIIVDVNGRQFQYWGGAWH